jgi:hypothetical protein
MIGHLMHRVINGLRQPGRIICSLLLAAIASAVLTTCMPAGRPPTDRTADAPPTGPAAAAPSAAPSNASLPRANLSLKDRASWRPILKWPDECEAAFQTSHAGDDPGIVFHELAPRLSIVEVLCAAGSYQPSSTFVRLDERGAAAEVTTLQFPVYESPNGAAFNVTRTTEIWGEVAIDRAKPIMTVLNLARQTADCGVWTRYNVGDVEPAVVDARARLPCSARIRPPIRLGTRQPPVAWRRVPH